MDDAWVRLPAVPGRPGVAYFAVHGGPQTRTLVAVSADYALRAEMHESMTDGAGAGGKMVTMRPIDTVPIPAGQEVRFDPGGRHVMLFGVDPAVKPGMTTLLTLTFRDGSRVFRKAQVIGAGDPTPE